jgi:cytochrome c oxidase subunit 2
MDTSRRRLCMAALAACALGQAGWRKAQAQAATDPPADGVREIAIEARRFFYAPNRIAVKLGEQVIVAITAIDFVHGFNVPDLHVRADLIPGRIVRVKLRFDQPGTVDFLCDNFCGDGHEGMSGKFIVTA